MESCNLSCVDDPAGNKYLLVWNDRRAPFVIFLGFVIPGVWAPCAPLKLRLFY